MRLIDVHAHDGPWERNDPTRYDYLGATMPEFIQDLDRDRIDLCFISSTQALMGDMIQGNAITYADALQDPRLFAYTYYNPAQVKESLAEIEKYKNHPKFIGFKSRPEYHRLSFAGPEYRPLAEMAAHLGKPILLHAWPIADAHDIVTVARETKATIIMVHACGPKYEEAADLVLPYERVFIEPVTSTHFPGKIRTLINRIGKDRMLFGTDYGLIARHRILKMYEEANLSTAEKEALFEQNAVRVFGL